MRYIGTLLALFGFLGAGVRAADIDLTDLSLEQLLGLQVVSASKFPQKRSDAPSAVTVITMAEIRAYGYRTLADILRSVRGLYVTNDRNYSYLGARGFGRTGDYNGRILLLVDGHRVNENVFYSGFLGQEFIVDVDLIDRVEFVPGPGSAIYGNNAFFGVVNVITRQGESIGGTQLSAEAGGSGSTKGRVTYGERIEGGADVLVSASGYRRHGENLFFSEFNSPATNNGVAQDLDYERNGSFFTKVASNGFTFEAAQVRRTKGVPTASFEQVFNDSRSKTVDGASFVSLAYDSIYAPRVDLYARVFYGKYDYWGDYIYDSGGVYVNYDEGRGAWRGAEMKVVDQSHAAHKLVAGAEYQSDDRQNLYNANLNPTVVNLDERRRGNRSGIYAQDEITLRENLLLSAGLRYDRATIGDNTTSPRLALIYKAADEITMKAIYGTAYRAPNVYELYYSFPGTDKANPGLKSEKIRTEELVLEKNFGPKTRLTASLFAYQIDNLISQVTDPVDSLRVFQNMSPVEAHGAEIEAERFYDSGARWRASYALQRAEDKTTGVRLVNSPRQLAKLNFSAPLGSETLHAGLEMQYTDNRRTRNGETGGYTVTNLTLMARRLAKGLKGSASVYNLFDKEYAYPAAEEHVMDVLREDGRSYRLKLTYIF